MLRHGLLTMRGFAKRSFIRKATRYSCGGLAVFSISYVIFHPKERKLLQSMLGSSVRFFRCLKIGLTISMDYWIAPIMDYKERDIHQRAANRIVEGCLKNGGVYIKLGQGLAAVNHVLPREYIDTLSILQDQCLTRGINEVEEIFLQDFGKKPKEIFKKMESKPVAAASLAQVFKGETVDGNRVAIKVQYIDLQDRFMSDIKTIKYLLEIVTIMHPKFNLHWVLDELVETLAQELDFEIEGKNSERCANDLKKYKYVYVPKVYWDISTKRILTTEWIDGIKINDTEEMKKQGLDIADVDAKLISLMAEQIFHTGFVHADPHPGNVLVRKGNDGKAQIVLLDHGLYENLSEDTRVSLCNFWESMVLKDSHRLKLHANELNVNDHILLAEMLTQAPYSLPMISTNKKTIDLTAEKYMIQQVQKRFDKITAALQSMPKTMMLIIRNLNTIRAITKDHGDVVDRYILMARSAVSGRYAVKNLSFRKKLTRIVNGMKFETYLWWHRILQYLLKIYLNTLQYMGYDMSRIMEIML